MTEIIQLVKKILLIGDPGSGKTSLIRKFVLDIFDDKYLTTLGTKVTNKTIILTPQELQEKVELKLMIWDVMGQTEYKLIQESAFLGASGAIVVGDLPRNETMEHLGNWVSDLFNITSVVPIVFVGNKVDLIDKTNMNLEQLEQLAMSYEAPYFLTSAKTGENVENTFETLGKQLVNASLDELREPEPQL
jgi:small GTP-binding protein